MARLLDYDIKISILVVGLSIGVLVNVAIGPNDDPSISLDIGLGLGLNEVKDDGFALPYFKNYNLLSTFHVAWPYVVFNCVKTWSLCNTTMYAPLHFMCMFSILSRYLTTYFKVFFLKCRIQELQLIVSIHNFPN